MSRCSCWTAAAGCRRGTRARRAATGYAADEIVGAPFARFYVPEDVEAARPQRALAAAERDGRYEEEGWRVRKDGSRFWAALTLTTLCDGAETPVGYAVVSRDRTDERVTGPFRLAVEAAPAGMIMVDDAGRIVMANAHVEKIFGYARKELIGHPVREARARAPANRPSPVRRCPPRPLRTAQGRHGGSDRAGPELSPDRRGSLRAQLGGRPVGEQARRGGTGSAAGRGPRPALRARTARSGAHGGARGRPEGARRPPPGGAPPRQEQPPADLELHQHAGPRDRSHASREALEDCRTRVQAIALIHEKLQHSQDYTWLPFSEFARDLARDVFNVAGVSRDKVSLELAVEHVTLAVDQAIPCGLILNELITNAVRHAFPEGRAGTVRVELAPAEGGLRLVVSDDGIGLAGGSRYRQVPLPGSPDRADAGEAAGRPSRGRRGGGDALPHHGPRRGIE